ncbi:MAG: PEP/pyruvate-binding domain-containing protein [bacterium]
MYERFREILNLNDSLLQLTADIEERLAGRTPFALEPMLQKVRKATMDVVMMVKDLNQLAEGRYRKLYDVLGKLNSELEQEVAKQRHVPSGPLTLPLDALRAKDAAIAGSKMANLGEVKSLGVAVPDGFVITTAAFARLMSENELWDRALQLEGILESYGMLALDNASRQVQGSVLSAEVPPEIERAILDGFDALSGGEEILVAMRSSAVGEDSASSHAGQYYTELNVFRDLLLDAYRTVVSSSYKPAAVSYRYERGLSHDETMMAVGCVRMLEPRVSGILFSRDFRDLQADRVVISLIAGTSEGIASGKKSAEEIVLTPGSSHLWPASTHLHARELDELVRVSRRLEEHFGHPQDIEWSLDKSGKLFILQSRPMAKAPDPDEALPNIRIDQEPLIQGGHVACAGIASGPVYHVKNEIDLDRFPDGAVLVARHSSPTFSRVITHCAAIVTDVGSPTGHMAILAREFGVPAIVGIEGAMRLLDPEKVITVDAASRRIFEGEVAPELVRRKVRPPLAGAPVVERLRRVARLVTPLHLTDPAAPNFKPSACQSLHDITRFVHEKVYEVMFRFGDMSAGGRQSSFKLDARLPLDVRVFDLGGSVAESRGEPGLVKPHEIVSAPMIAFLEGLMDARIKWDQPRPLSARGFLSVLGQGMAAPPAHVQKVGSVSYVVASDRYMNFSTKAGYHFSTVDVYCGQSQNKNYIHFRFTGGGAAMDRRSRRVRFLSEVLSNLDFRIQTREDLLVARMEKYDRYFICARLSDLGRLTLCSRQLDMLMDNDNSPHFFAQAFLNGEWERF